MQSSAFGVKMEEIVCGLILPVPDEKDAHGVGDVHVNIHIHLLSLDNVWRKIRAASEREPMR